MTTTRIFPAEVTDVGSFNCWLRMNQTYIKDLLSRDLDVIPESRREKAEAFTQCFTDNNSNSGFENPLKRVFGCECGYYCEELEWLKIYLKEELDNCLRVLECLENNDHCCNEVYSQMNHIGETTSVTFVARNCIFAMENMINSFRKIKKDIQIILRVLDEGQEYVESLFYEKA